MEVKLKHLLYHRDQENCIGKVRKVAILWHCPSPRPTQHHMERSLLSLWFLQWGKGGGFQPPPSVLGHFMESHTLVSTTRIAGSLWAQSEKFYYDKEGRGVSNNQSTEPNRWYIVNMKLCGVYEFLI